MSPRHPDYVNWSEIESELSRITVCASSQAEYAELGGDISAADVYRETREQVEKTIRLLMGVREDLFSLAGHAHTWNSDDYRDICGADGRA